MIPFSVHKFKSYAGKMQNCFTHKKQAGAPLPVKIIPYSVVPLCQRQCGPCE